MRKGACAGTSTDRISRTPFTNNEGERDLRMGKLRQKISVIRLPLDEEGAWDFANLPVRHRHGPKAGLECSSQPGAHPDPMQLIPQRRLRF